MSCHGRPRLSALGRRRSTGSSTSHCSSVNSQRTRIVAFGKQQSVSRVPPKLLSPIYETGSRLMNVAALRLERVFFHLTKSTSSFVNSLDSWGCP